MLWPACSRSNCDAVSQQPNQRGQRPATTSWVLETHERGQVQSAYQVLAATALEKLSDGAADLWNSGQVRSNRSAQVVYGANPGVAYSRFFWKVRVWDRGREQRPGGRNRPSGEWVCARRMTGRPVGSPIAAAWPKLRPDQPARRNGFHSH